jgi:hypothetical protein
MSEYYKLGLYATNDEIDDDEYGYVDLEDLPSPNIPDSISIEIEVRGAGFSTEIGEGEERIGGYLSQAKGARRIYEIPVRPLKHPEDTNMRELIYAIFNYPNLFLFPIEYDAPISICPDGKAVRVAGNVETSHNYDDGTKELTIKLSRAELY